MYKADSGGFLSTLKVLQDDRFDQEHRELLADVLLGDVDVYLREGLDKKWFDGGKSGKEKKNCGTFQDVRPDLPMLLSVLHDLIL